VILPAYNNLAQIMLRRNNTFCVRKKRRGGNWLRRDGYSGTDIWRIEPSGLRAAMTVACRCGRLRSADRSGARVARRPRHLLTPRARPFSANFRGTHWPAFEWLSEVVFALAYAAGGWMGMVAIASAAAATQSLKRFILRCSKKGGTLPPEA
jgi:hypothetical protein